MIATPLITIITVAYNAASTLEETIMSVSSQNDNVEFIIIDGGSTDETLRILKRNKAVISHYVSEPDRGIYDAMNKAIDLASGQWLYFLGANDKLEPRAITAISPHLKEEFVLVCGAVKFSNGSHMYSFMGWMTWLQNTIHHQSAFYHKSLFSDFRYDVSLRTIADYELNLLIFINKWPISFLPTIVASCQTGGVSSNWRLTISECDYIRSKYIKSNWRQALLSLSLKLYYAQKLLRYNLFGTPIG